MSSSWDQINAETPSRPEGDEAYMSIALGLARRMLGRVWPNPAVGCVIVKDGAVVGRGVTQPGGRPHAETVALAQAGEAARGATAYVTLEPCSHTGKTGPCSEALITSGINRVVTALEDPDARVSGRGHKMLREAGIEVTVGVCAEEAYEVNEGFLLKVTLNRPMFTLKMATTLDGKIAVHTGESKWITGPHTRMTAHMLRANHDAIMVGIGTASEDNPHLTCRLPGLESRSPVRIVIDRRMRLPLTTNLVATAHKTPTWLITAGISDEIRAEAYEAAGVELIVAPADDGGGITLPWVAEELARRGLTRVLVEGGSHLAGAMVRRDLVDRLVWMRAPKLIGHDGVPALQAFGVDRLSDSPEFHVLDQRSLDQDAIDVFKRRRPEGPA